MTEGRAAVGEQLVGFIFIRGRLEGHVPEYVQGLLQEHAESPVVDDRTLRSFEEELRTMYAALPKTARGALEPSVVRYALHRYCCTNMVGT